MSQSPSSSSSGAGGGTVGDEGEKIALAITTAYGTKNVSEVNCIDIFDRLWYCGTPMNQLDAFYKTGDIENCGAYVHDWITCFKAKTKKDPNERENLLSSMSVAQKSIAGNRILLPKEVPGWK